MRFEFDDKKSKSNKAKHGIDFVEAQEIWNRETLTLRSNNPTEERLLVIGRIRKKFWTAIITMRKGVIRIISVRRSRNEEKEIYCQK